MTETIIFITIILLGFAGWPFAIWREYKRQNTKRVFRLQFFDGVPYITYKRNDELYNRIFMKVYKL